MTMNQAIKAELRRFLEETFFMGGGGPALDDSASFLEHHVLDSTGFLELIAHLEETYGIKVGDDEMLPENLDSLDALDAFLHRKRDRGQA
ncbi:MAG: acyl carrier protein [Burkholderiales bacterium]|nr:acyl carrier protein [Burkholderiales bacterium]